MTTDRRENRRAAFPDRRGITLVELIVVIAITGILAVVIGSLLSSASTAYAREKEAASAKEIALDVAKAIRLEIWKSDKVSLGSDGGDNSLSRFDVSGRGRLCLSDEDYFPDADESGKNPFYGRYRVEVRYGAVKNGWDEGKERLLIVYVIVKTENGKTVYNPGRDGVPVRFLKDNNTDTQVIQVEGDPVYDDRYDYYYYDKLWFGRDS